MGRGGGEESRFGIWAGVREREYHDGYRKSSGEWEWGKNMGL